MSTSLQHSRNQNVRDIAAARLEPRVSHDLPTAEYYTGERENRMNARREKLTRAKTHTESVNRQRLQATA